MNYTASLEQKKTGLEITGAELKTRILAIKTKSERLGLEKAQLALDYAVSISKRSYCLWYLITIRTQWNSYERFMTTY